jgi:glycerol kinase
LLIDPYFSASGAKWILDNVEGARAAAEAGDLLMGTVECWLIWKLTGGRVHATDYTNASRTLLFNIHTLDWDDDLLGLFTIPRNMMADPRPCDAFYGETTAEGLFEQPVRIAGVLGDSHGALAGQMCFAEGLGKATYGTGSSVMVNVGEVCAAPPAGLVTSVGFAALGKVFYAFEGNIHCTGATITWLKDKLGLIAGAGEIEAVATSVPDNGGVYFVPAFAGLGAPWWHPEVKAQISGLSLGSTRAHVCRAALESIAFQVTDLVKAMTDSAGISLKEIRVDGGPTKNAFLMQLQSDLLQVPVVRSEVEDASAFGAFVMNGFARGKWTSFGQAADVWNGEAPVLPQSGSGVEDNYKGWQAAVRQLIK